MRRSLVGIVALAAVSFIGYAVIQLTADSCDSDSPAAAGGPASDSVYDTYQLNEELIFKIVEEELGERQAGMWLTRGSWDVNIGYVGDLGVLPDRLPATDKITYVFHERGESLASLQARAAEEGKRVDVPTGEMCPAEDFIPTPSDL